MNFIVKPTSFLCNMVCKYCFYLEKADFMTKENNTTHFMQNKNLYQLWKKEFPIAKIKI